jgi:hypothetical protein
MNTYIMSSFYLSNLIRMMVTNLQQLGIFVFCFNYTRNSLYQVDNFSKNRAQQLGEPRFSKACSFSISLDFSTNLLVTLVAFLFLHPSILFDNLVPLLRVVPLDVRQSPLDLAHLIRGALRARPSQDERRKSCENEAEYCMLYTSE